MKLCSNIQIGHPLMATPLFEQHTGENVFVVLKKLLDAVFNPMWGLKCISVYSNGARNKTVCTPSHVSSSIRGDRNTFQFPGWIKYSIQQFFQNNKHIFPCMLFKQRNCHQVKVKKRAIYMKSCSNIQIGHPLMSRAIKCQCECPSLLHYIRKDL